MKTSIEQLAIFGGTPAFAEKLHVGRPNIGDRDRLLARINESLDSRWLSNGGPHEMELERRIADMTGARHCIAMCNATVALEIAMRALDLSGEVIVPSFTFIATAHALQWQQITPVFCDIDPKTHSIDPQRISELVSNDTTGIIGVHLWGRPCEIDELEAIAAKHNLKLLFDAAHAFACSYKGKMIGNFGAAEVFSFHATKFFNTLEGGAVTTNDDDLASKIRLMKNFGFAGYDTVSYIGTNGKMNELSAAMGLTSFDSLNEFIEVNHRNYNQYQESLKTIPGVHLFQHDKIERGNRQYVVVEIDEQLTGLTRDELVTILWKENVVARRYFYPGCHRMEPYRTKYPQAGLKLPETERLIHRVMSLPTGTAVDTTKIEIICDVIRTAVAEGATVHRRLLEQESPFAAAKPS